LTTIGKAQVSVLNHHAEHGLTEYWPIYDFIRKLDKPKLRDPDHPKESAHDLLGTDQDLMNKATDQWLDRISLVIRAKEGY